MSKKPTFEELFMRISVYKNRVKSISEHAERVEKQNEKLSEENKSLTEEKKKLNAEIKQLAKGGGYLTGTIKEFTTKTNGRNYLRLAVRNTEDNDKLLAAMRIELN